MALHTNQQLYRSNAVNGDYLHNSIETVLSEIGMVLRDTYGPYGSHNLIQGPDFSVMATKDGDKNLTNLAFDKTISNVVLKTVQSVSAKQDEEVGDGTTSTGLLTVELYKAFREIMKSNNIAPSTFKRKVQNVITLLISELRKNAIETTDKILYDTIYTSLDGEELLADKLMDLLTTLNSQSPLILLDYSVTDATHYELIKGVELKGTIIRPDIFFGGRSKKTYDSPVVIVIDGRLDITIDLLMDVTEMTRREGRDLIFVATGVTERILEMVVSLSSTNPTLFNRMALFQYLGDATSNNISDLAMMLGSHVLNEETLKRCKTTSQFFDYSNSFGTATKVEISEMYAKFSEPNTDMVRVEERVNEIDDKINTLKADSDQHSNEITELETKKAFLSNNYAKFLVGGVSQERKTINIELMKDAIQQSLSAREHGVVEGCNTAIPSIVDSIDSNIDSVELLIMNAIRDGYLRLFAYILDNKHGNLDESTKLVSDHITSNGYTAMNIRDNHKVYNSADTDRAILENATDMAVLLATTKTFISLRPEFDVIDKFND